MRLEMYTMCEDVQYRDKMYDVRIEHHKDDSISICDIFEHKTDNNITDSWNWLDSYTLLQILKFDLGII